jgi:putative transport protein
MMSLFVESPLLLLFVVASFGYLAGKVSVFGTRLGVAAVLFVGLAFGGLDPHLKLPDIVDQLGLVLFVYAVGLSSGPRFFDSLRRGGWRDNLLVSAMIALGVGIVTAASWLFGLRPAVSAGMFCGSMTCTPALAAVLQLIRGRPGVTADAAVLADPVVGYSIAYPIGILGVIAAIAVLRRFWGVDFAAEAQTQPGAGGAAGRLANRTLLVNRPQAVGRTTDEIVAAEGLDVIFGRRLHAGRLALADGSTPLEDGDLITLIGTAEELDRASAVLGEPSPRRLELERGQLDYRRILISNPRVAGHALWELGLPQQFGAVVTRLRRGDVELLPHADTVLELGDRARVLTSCANLEAVSGLLGDSEREVSEVDILSLGLGVALGLLLGRLSIPLPGGTGLQLGAAGGPLVVALILGTLHRTGPLIWTLPWGANLTLRQFGLVLFLAGVGLRSGHTFFETLSRGEGLTVFLGGAAVTCIVATTALWIGHRLLRIPLGTMTGIVAGLQTQPALLAYAQEQTRNDLPNIGYATVYPLAFIAKIIIAQVLFVLLS